MVGAALVVLVLIGLVLFFYRPTGLALERAEAFQFRRTLVTRLDTDGAYRFFYVTNRGPDREARVVVKPWSAHRGRVFIQRLECIASLQRGMSTQGPSEDVADRHFGPYNDGPGMTPVPSQGSNRLPGAGQCR